MRARLSRSLVRRASTGVDSVDLEVAELRRRALAHEAGGHLGEAVAVWTMLNRLQATPQVEEHLVNLRADPTINNRGGVAVEPWPRPLADPFPDVVGQPPEIDANELSMELLGGAILHHGCLLVRGLLDPERANELRGTIDRALAGRREHLQGTPTGETSPWYVPCAQWDAITPDRARKGRRYTDTAGCAVHLCDSPRALFQVVEALQATKVVPVVSEYFGEAPVLSANKSMLRRVPPDAQPSWHQDGSFIGAAARAVNVWVALSDCGDGRDAPGIAILPRRLDVSVRGEVSDANIVFSEDEFEYASAGTAVVKPTFAPGDALMFDELLPHANGGGEPGLTRHRYALETWLFAPAFMREDYLPISVQ